MIRTIINDSFDINHWITSNNTVFHSFFDTIFDWSDVFFRNSTTNDFAFEGETFTWILWNEFNPAMTILTFTTGLTNEFTFRFNCFADCFTVSNLWFTYFTIYFKFAAHTVYDNIEM